MSAILQHVLVEMHIPLTVLESNLVFLVSETLLYHVPDGGTMRSPRSGLAAPFQAPGSARDFCDRPAMPSQFNEYIDHAYVPSPSAKLRTLVFHLAARTIRVLELY